MDDSLKCRIPKKANEAKPQTDTCPRANGGNNSRKKHAGTQISQII